MFTIRIDVGSDVALATGDALAAAADTAAEALYGGVGLPRPEVRLERTGTGGCGARIAAGDAVVYRWVADPDDVADVAAELLRVRPAPAQQHDYAGLARHLRASDPDSPLVPVAVRAALYHGVRAQALVDELRVALGDDPPIALVPTAVELAVDRLAPTGADASDVLVRDIGFRVPAVPVTAGVGQLGELSIPVRARVAPSRRADWLARDLAGAQLVVSTSAPTLGLMIHAFPMPVFNVIETCGTAGVLCYLRALLDEHVPTRDLRRVLGGVLAHVTDADPADCDGCVDRVRARIADQLLDDDGWRTRRPLRWTGVALGERPLDAFAAARDAIRAAETDGPVVVVTPDPSRRRQLRTLVGAEYPELPIITDEEHAEATRLLGI